MSRKNEFLCNVVVRRLKNYKKKNALNISTFLAFMIYRAKQCMKGIAQLLQFHEIFPLEQFWTFLRNPVFNLHQTNSFCTICLQFDAHSIQKMHECYKIQKVHHIVTK